MNLTDPKTLRELLQRHGVAARKGLGQHFLCSPSAVDAVLHRLSGFRGALEIGPGPGVLTRSLSEKLERVIALEIDAEMVDVLKESAPAAEVRRVDALKSDLTLILQDLPMPRAVVSNLPYYITGALVSAIAEVRSHYDKALLMMQREVGIRILAKPGERERGSLSVYLQACFEIRKVADVPKGAFYPPPKVDSVILEFVPKPEATYPEAFFRFVRQGFTQPRKMLLNNYKSGVKEAVGLALEDHDISTTIRPHQLHLDQWVHIYEWVCKEGSSFDE